MMQILFGFWVLTFLLAAFLLVAYKRVAKACDRAQEENDEHQEDLAFAIAQTEARCSLNVENLVNERIIKLREQFEKDNVDIINQALLKPSTKDLVTKLHAMARVRSERYVQEFLGNITDDVEGVARNLKEELNDKIWDAFQTYKCHHRDSPYVFPENVKVAYTKGKRTVFIIEQKPQTRTVSFSGKLVKTQNLANESLGNSSTGWRYNLAFPYVNFICTFDDELMASLEVYFRNKPLTSHREHIYLAPIPNVFSRKDDPVPMMCMGKDFSDKLHSETTMARQCEFAISEFWQRTFNADLGSGGHEKIDPRIANYAVWQQNTQENPLFILDVAWQKGKTVKQVIDANLDSRTRNHSLDGVEVVIRDLLDQGTDSVKAKIEEVIEDTRKKRYKFTPDELEAKALLQDLLRKHATEVFNKVTTIH